MRILVNNILLSFCLAAASASTGYCAELTEAPAQALGNNAFQAQVLKAVPAKSIDAVRGSIVNGVYSSNHPSVGVLLHAASGQQWEGQCTGTLVGCSTFVTAAHCVSDSGDYAVFFPHAGFYAMSGSPIPHPQFNFPDADIAVIRLAGPVDRVRPSTMSARVVGLGAEATIVGYGTAGGNASDFGLKRFGAVKTTVCSTTGGVKPKDDNSICWTFKATGAPGADSSTCHGDSGGPLFIPAGNRTELAGVTSGEPDGSCSAGARPFDTRLSKYLPWVKQTGGADVAGGQCFSQDNSVGSPGARWYGINGQLAGSDDLERHTVKVPAGIKTIRVGLNGYGEDAVSFEISMSSPSGQAACTAETRSLFSFCSVKNPGAGTWGITVKVKRQSTSQPSPALYQLVTTLLK